MRFSCGPPSVDGCTPSTKFDMTITKTVRKFKKRNEAEKWGLVMDSLSLQDRIATGLCYCKDGDNCVDVHTDPETLERRAREEPGNYVVPLASPWMALWAKVAVRGGHSVQQSLAEHMNIPIPASSHPKQVFVVPLQGVDNR